ncbi:hypothetical protein SVAN01_11631 [Stagonosporopsis vannaccii]|nr:hypothetical protein SVAN01_11631 [Stagonosporopsis vannaccii]
MGPLLGGGHSVLQAAPGFAADELVSAKVALHNDTVFLASTNENEDLFWGLRSGEHNLGMVHDFEVKVYCVHLEPSTFMTFMFAIIAIFKGILNYGHKTTILFWGLALGS